jgi:23S rRNA (uracil1939-C5)-methyltransferase
MGSARTLDAVRNFSKRGQIKRPRERAFEMIFSVEIERVGHRGVGIAHHRGKVIMVPLTAPGDRAEVRITRSHRTYDEAELVKLQESSRARRDPPCPYYGRCGGCQLQHFDLPHQRALKEMLFLEILTNKAGVSREGIKGILATQEELGYRSSLGMHAAWDRGSLVGFTIRGGRDLVSVDRCLLALPALQPLFLDLPKIHQTSRATGISRMEISCDSPGEATNVVLWASGTLARRTRDVITRLAPEVRGLRGAYLANRYGGNIQPLWSQEGSPKGVTYTIPGHRGPGDLLLETWPGVFRQVNPSINRLLIAAALAWTEEGPHERILDLYSGMGNLALPMAFQAREVTAVEINPLAVDNARCNAQRLGIDNVRWIQASAERALQEVSAGGKTFDLVVLDPPRKGAREILEGIAALAPTRILYISCDMATLSRDLRFLRHQSPYRVEKAQPLDMFPQTFHLESMTLLHR